MDKLFHLMLYWACDFLSMLVSKLIHVSKRGPRNFRKSYKNEEVLQKNAFSEDIMDKSEWRHGQKHLKWAHIQQQGGLELV